MSLFGGRGDKGDKQRERGDRAVGSGAQADSRAAAAHPQAGGGEPARKRNQNEGGRDVATIGKSVVFSGDVSGEEDLEIEGQVEGQIRLPNHQLTVGAHGRVKAQIDAKAVVVVGRVHGNITASERCEVQGSGIVVGDIRAPRLLVHEGAVVNGKIEMGGLADSATDATATGAGNDSQAHARSEGTAQAGPEDRFARSGSR